MLTIQPVNAFEFETFRTFNKVHIKFIFISSLDFASPQFSW